MLAPAAMEGEETGRERRTKVRSEKEMQRRASRSAFIRELANELEGRPEEVWSLYTVFCRVYMQSIIDNDATMDNIVSFIKEGFWATNLLLLCCILGS